MLIPGVLETIRSINPKLLPQERREILEPLKQYVYKRFHAKQPILLNFICTHNSRRSQFAQMWAQTMSSYFGINNVLAFSGGTEVTRLYKQVALTLTNQGFLIKQLSNGDNPIYSVKFKESQMPMIGFSKLYDDAFNPGSGYAAIMTCDQAHEECPVIIGAEQRIPISIQDPKFSDGTQQEEEVYRAKSLEIASEMYFVFSKIAKLW